MDPDISSNALTPPGRASPPWPTRSTHPGRPIRRHSWIRLALPGVNGLEPRLSQITRLRTGYRPERQTFICIIGSDRVEKRKEAFVGVGDREWCAAGERKPRRWSRSARVSGSGAGSNGSPNQGDTCGTEL